MNEGATCGKLREVDRRRRARAGLVRYLLSTVGIEPTNHFGWGQRAAEKIALDAIAASLTQRIELIFRLDALGDNFHVELMAHLNDFLDHDKIAVIRVHIHHKRLVNLQLDCGNVLQLLHHGVAGAEVVNRELEVSHPQPREYVERERKLDQPGLGNFQDNVFRREVVLLGEAHEDVRELEIAKGAHGDIDREARKKSVRPNKLFYFLESSFRRDPAEFVHQLQRFYARDEVVREDQSKFRMLPAGQSLDAGNSSRLDVDLRLVVQHKLIPFESLAQLLIGNRDWRMLFVSLGPFR